MRLLGSLEFLIVIGTLAAFMLVGVFNVGPS